VTALARHAHPPLAAYACLAASMALVGSYVGLSKLLVATFPVFLLAWLRYGLAALAMLHWLRRPAHEAPLSRHDRLLLFWIALLGSVMFSLFMLNGMRHASALVAGVVMAAIPAAVALLSWLLLRERVAARTALGIACAVAGIALVSLLRHGDGGGGGSTAIGVALLLAAVLCEASYVVIGKRLSAAVGARRISALANLWSLALVTPVGLWQALDFDFGTVGAPMWALLVFYTLASSIVTVWLWMTGLREVSASQAGVFTVMLPIGAAAVGVVFLGERFGAAHVAAFALALAGVLLAAWPQRRERYDDA
jgi:drug/metabolite transporter (DMT)-like permease